MSNNGRAILVCLLGIAANLVALLGVMVNAGR